MVTLDMLQKLTRPQEKSGSQKRGEATDHITKIVNGVSQLFIHTMEQMSASASEKIFISNCRINQGQQAGDIGMRKHYG
jgi:hypothetical protein